MAGSRLPNFGTIFSRMTGLLETGGVKDVPIWYGVYKKHPPELEPIAERAIPPQDPIPDIIYEEDFERAKTANKRDSSQSTSKKQLNRVETLIKPEKN